MWDRTRIATIAGILAYVVTILVLFIPFKGEPAMSLINWHTPLGFLVIVLFVASVVFYGIACLKRETHFPYKEEKVKQRREELPLLRHSIDAIITRQKELALEIGKTPLDDLYKRYLKINKSYKVYLKLLHMTHKSDEETKHKLAILQSIVPYFYPKAIHLNNVSKDDEKMGKLKAEQSIRYRRNDDKELSGIIDDLLARATQYHSILALAELGVNSGFSFKSAKNYAVLEEKPQILERRMIGAYKAMDERMKLLMRGSDL